MIMLMVGYVAPLIAFVLVAMQPHWTGRPHEAVGRVRQKLWHSGFEKRECRTDHLALAQRGDRPVSLIVAIRARLRSR